MRARRSGAIVNISSIGAQLTPVGSGYYAAAKAAIEGLSGALRGELAPLGISVTVVEPGAFRTDFAGRSLAQSATVIDDYAGTAGQRRKENDTMHGNQAGDPAKAGRGDHRGRRSERAPGIPAARPRRAGPSIATSRTHARTRSRSGKSSPAAPISTESQPRSWARAPRPTLREWLRRLREGYSPEPRDALRSVVIEGRSSTVPNTLELDRPCDGVVVVRLNRPERLNAINEVMQTELRADPGRFGGRPVGARRRAHRRRARLLRRDRHARLRTQRAGGNRAGAGADALPGEHGRARRRRAPAAAARHRRGQRPVRRCRIGAVPCRRHPDLFGGQPRSATPPSCSGCRAPRWA